MSTRHEYDVATIFAALLQMCGARCALLVFLSTRHEYEYEGKIPTILAVTLYSISKSDVNGKTTSIHSKK